MKHFLRFKVRFVVVLITILVGVMATLVTVQSYAQAASESPKPASSFWLWEFLGRLHPLAVHFPVALLLLAAIMELFTIKKYNSKLRQGIYILVVTGEAAAVISVILGLMLARGGDYGADLLALHQWTGIGTAVLGGVALFFLYKNEKQPKTSLVKMYRGVLFTTAIGVSVAGHFGASLTHGDDYLSSTIPWSENYADAPASNFSFASISDTAKLNTKQEQELNVQVRAVLAHNCYKCHGADTVKGSLRLDSKSFVFKGGESGPAVVSGKPDESELYRRITLPAEHKDVMPSKGKKLADGDIKLIKFWIEKGAPWPEGKQDIIFKIAKLQPRNPALPAAPANLKNPIDIWVNQYFKNNKAKWPALVDDRTYLRRIYLDIIGLLPKQEEQDAFAADTRADKRALWVRQLLNRNEDYATNWLTFWNDALRNDYTGTGYITGGRFDITDWLYTALKTDMPYNEFVKELLNPSDKSKGFIEGIKWRGVINSSQSTEMQAAQNVSQVFFGLNLKCASCHNSFISDWKLDDAYAFANIFADSSLEINRCDKPTGKFTNARMLWKELGNIDSGATTKVKRQQLSENMIKPENGRLYRTIVNRVWAQMLGRGMVEPVDVMDNDPWSQDLLDWLAYNFVEHKCDIKELIYLISTSNTYQLPSVGFKEASMLTAQNFKFTGIMRKRMTGEQFSDAVSDVIAPVFADSMVGFNPYKKANAQETANPIFFRASLVVNNPFLTALGRPNRETVSTTRDGQANLLQALELTKGQRLDETLKKGAAQWISTYKTSDAIINEIYRKALGRMPTPKEIVVAKKALGNTPTVDGVQDLFWAIVLLPEFQIIY